MLRSDRKQKSYYTKAVLEQLPDWFGDKQALDAYVLKVAELPYRAALNKAHTCVGFFAVKTHYGYTGAILMCGILPEYQHTGIGKTLYRLAEYYFMQVGCKYCIVKTLSDTVTYEPYAQTRKFYKKWGLIP